MADSNTTFNSTFNGTFNGTGDPFTAAPKPFWTNLLLPFLYLTIVIGSLITFSSTYRARQLAKQASLEPWFPPHTQRDIYLSLLHLDPAESATPGSQEKKLSKVPDSVLKAALLRRAVEDIERIVKLRASKPAIASLLQRGSVSDELMQRFVRAEKEMEAEVKDVVEEANAFTPGWGQVIFQSANEINQNRLLKERQAELLATREAEKEWWEKRREGIKEQLLVELDDEASKNGNTAPSTPAKKNGSDDDAVIVEAGGKADGNANKGSGKKKGKN